MSSTLLRWFLICWYYLTWRMVLAPGPRALRHALGRDFPNTRKYSAMHIAMLYHVARHPESVHPRLTPTKS